ncbi:ABC transporter substrate-binding protein [Nesterenkonia cremea]|uniref:Sulfonate ABC transporter substrate-binding protein n=1 Tax=Nesterenkonia cremea TaxID=1882340 RepID=A0A917ANS1_9MICC|nr:ABC transporter substrate-binding protein [Nesterenkonia cremea]GGE63273.1 sulfonate ABC transporter substrate-binding protein [Nesterenkonia cremea]
MHKKTTVTGSTLAALALTLTACGGDGDAADDGELTDISLGVLNIAPSAAVQYGLDEGIFEEHGFNVEIVEGQGAGAMLPAVQTGDMDFAVGNALSVLTAVDQGLEMRLLTGYSHSYAEGDDINGVVVRSEDDIEGWSDLDGLDVAVNVLNGQGDLTIMEAVSQDGGDPNSLGLTEIDFPEMTAQLERGNVDAIWLPEPFLSQTLADDEFELLGHPNQEVIPGLPTMHSFTSAQYAEQNPELTEQFQEAMDEALTAAEEDPEGTAQALATFLDMDEDVAADVRLEEFDADPRVEQLDTMVELMVEYDFIDEPVNLDEVVLD